jgi:hypothetical protein
MNAKAKDNRAYFDKLSNHTALVKMFPATFESNAKRLYFIRSAHSAVGTTHF